MLSGGRIGAGDGYRYLTSQVASHDVRRAGERLASYYERTGMPPGVWAGAQADAFGLAGAPTEEQMENLYGRCHDPSTGEPLGRRMPSFPSLSERVANRLAELGRPATAAERAAIDTSERVKAQPRAVTAFDLTFSPPKSVSVLWALGGDEIRDVVQAAHEGAWRDALAHFEAEVACTRLGGAGVAQVDVDGVTVAAFEHWFNRAGDPQLHTHLAVSAMVRATDTGRWRRLDSRAMYRAAASVGERYTGSVLARLSDELGVGVRHRQGRGDRPLPELEGVDDRLIEVFSPRAAQVDANLARLVGEYADAHGYVPDRDTTARLAQQAVLMDRPMCEQRSWVVERAGWLDRAAAVLGVAPDEVEPTLVDATVGVRGPLRVDTDKSEARAADVLARLGARAATWNRRDIAREAAAVLREDGARVDTLSVTALVDSVQNHGDSVSLTFADVGGAVPGELRRADGSSAFVRRGEQQFTSRAILNAERELAALAGVRSLPQSERSRRFRAGWSELNDDDLVRRVAAADTQIAVFDMTIREAEADHPRLKTAAVEATVAVRAAMEMPASATMRAELAVERDAALRVAEIDRALAARGLRAPSRRERARLSTEANALRHAYPQINLDAQLRRERAAERMTRAGAADARTLADAETAANEATGAVTRHATKLALLVAGRAEQAEGRDALAVELAVREGIAGRVSMVGYLDGLGVDQAAAMVRLADPSAPLAALIGPAGSGKTTALAALVAAHTDAGRTVYVLAPTAVAAAAVGDAVGVPGQTLAKALTLWDHEMSLPGRGDLILIDEASTAATLDVAHAVRVAQAHGALLRLIGDPRQAKAVGAGGALEIVALASNAPQLTELHRFAHEWEGKATLRLRAGDGGVVDVYETHERIRSGSYASMLEDTYRQYRNATTIDPGAAIMIVSDNHSVQALSERARADRVADSRVEPGGVRLHDGSVAGIGDLIVTRRNDRQLRTGPGDAAFVRNRDRFEIIGRDPAGTLTVRRVDSDQTTALPADYVADHVELSYALTGYGAQGITVKEALAIVQPGDERSFAYVAASRGTDTNMIRVVTETLDEEPAGHQPERSARDVLGDVLANDPAVSAGQALDAAAVRQYDAAELFNRHRHTTRTVAEHTLVGVLEARGAADLLNALDAWRLIEETERATERGLDPESILAAATDDQLATIDDATGVVRAARLYPAGQRLPYPDLIADLVPAATKAAQPDVAAYLDGLAAGLARRRATLTDDYRHSPPPAWAASLGTPPADPASRARWADAVARVGVWREAHAISGADPLGRSLPPGHRDGPGRARAVMAAAEAVELATAMTPDLSAISVLRERLHAALDLGATRADVPDRSR
ncbi:MAG: MobF family relaxase [Acidimicrobiales bacterium]